MVGVTGVGVPIRVYLEDTDAGGIVFYANYLKYFERARTEFIRRLGFQLRQGLQDNISYVVHSIEIKYLRPARLDDELLAHAEIEQLGRSFMLFHQWVEKKDGTVLVEGRVKVVCTSLDSGKPRALDERLQVLLKSAH
jgi:tol-pal system-associated acyl-CoA thioesterase